MEFTLAENELLAEQLQSLHRQLPALNFERCSDKPDDFTNTLTGAGNTYQSNARAYLDHYGLTALSEADGIRHFLGSKKCGGHTIACQYWLPKAPLGTAFVVHGYFDHTGLYGHLFEYLLSKNLAVVAFDLPGHGLSGGERVTIASFDHYVEIFEEILAYAKGHLPQPWHGIGQSTGGAIVLKHLLTENPEKPTFSNIALLAPLLHPYRWQGNRLIYLIAHRFLPRIKRHFAKNSSDPAFVNFVTQQDPLQALHIPLEWIGAMKRWTEEFHDLPDNSFPLHIIQGDLDKTLDWRYNLEQFRRKLPRANICMVPGAHHHLVNETETLRKQAFKFMGLEQKSLEQNGSEDPPTL
jgi:lysophospholipase